MSFRVVSRIAGPKWKDYCAERGIEVECVELEINDEDGIIEKMKGFDGIIAGGEPYTARVLDALKDHLKIIARHGIGYDKVDVAHATELGICCCNTPGTMSTGVAESALILMLELTRKFYQRNAALQQGKWDKGTMVHQFEGATIGLFGFGNIAQCLARYISGFSGCRVLAYDIHYNEEALKKYGVEKATFEQVVRESDFVSIHVPLMPATNKIVNDEFLAMMKPTAYLINTSRGGTVDEQALIRALKNGVIAGAGMDVFEKEPADPTNELFALENVFKTPHIATNTFECVQAGFDGVIKCLKEFENGQVPTFTLNPGYVD